MGDKKLWTRADIRAEMNRLVKSATDACKIIHAANAAIEALGKESGFEDAATRAMRQLAMRACPEWKPAAAAAAPKAIPRIENAEALREALRPKSAVQRALETWGAQGCTCDMHGFSVSTDVTHAHGCRVRGAGWSE